MVVFSRRRRSRAVTALNNESAVLSVLSRQIIVPDGWYGAMKCVCVCVCCKGKGETDNSGNRE